MAPRLAFAVPGGIELKTGGAIYDKRLVEVLEAAGWAVDLIVWPGTFPFPSPEDRATAAASLAALPDGTRVLIDGLGLGVLPELAAREAGRLRLAALVHHPLALETGLSPEVAAALAASERAALAPVGSVIVTSRATGASLLADYGVPAERLTVAVPGVGPAAPPSLPPPGGPVLLLTVGSVIPRKGHLVLAEALLALPDLDWRWTVAGSLARAPETAAALAAAAARPGLAGRTQILGEVADPAPLYAQADVFALPSFYEGYGIAFAEALAHGLPVVAANAGAVPEVIPQGAGLLVPPGDARALAEALRRIVGDGALRARLAVGARAAGGALPRWPEALAPAVEALKRL